MLIDTYLDTWHMAKAYSLEIAGDQASVFAAARNVNIRRSPAIMALWAMRMLPWAVLQNNLREVAGIKSYEDLSRIGFCLLVEEPGQELVLGFAGEFWRMAPELGVGNAEEFRAFSRPEAAKAVWNLHVRQVSPGLCLVSTETRVKCLSEAALRRFQRYWSTIGPFSGLIRRELLRLAKRNAKRMGQGQRAQVQAV
ncbi:MAG: hypothetical protein D6E12_06905 [Desulfovibrio sp.]|nr:MAG: hypothetical protein D6E12_06905 [Desulfovibrio sp.]